MTLAIAVLAMVGSLCAAIGSGLQAREDFAGYRSVLEEIGVPRASSSFKSYLTHFFALMPLAKTARNYPRARANPEFERRLKDSIAGVGEAGTALKADVQSVRSRAQDDERASALRRKATYWVLILLGSLALFAGALVALIADLTAR